MSDLAATITQRGAIAGRITDARTSRPIADAEVSIASLNQSKLTDTEGFYGFINLKKGSYQIVVSAPAKYSRYGKATINAIAVDENAQGQPVFDAKANVQLAPTTLSGTITNRADAAAVAGAIVQLRGGSASTVSASDGKFVLSPILAGKPKLQVSLSGFKTFVQEVTLTPGQEVSLAVALDPA